jgi:hypothetical protein
MAAYPFSNKKNATPYFGSFAVENFSSLRLLAAIGNTTSALCSQQAPSAAGKGEKQPFRTD